MGLFSGASRRSSRRPTSDSEPSVCGRRWVMSIEVVREKFRWGDEAKEALRNVEQAIETLFTTGSGFRNNETGLNLRLEDDHGGDLVTTITEACDALICSHHNTRHPRSLAHMVPPPATASVLGDLLKGAWNQCAFTWEQGPLVPAMEA